MEPLHHQQDPQHQMQSLYQLQQQQQQVHYINIEDSSSGSSSNSKNSSLLCRQNNTCSSTAVRWTPTSDQIRILKDLYYNNGVKSPSAEQIQRISARLRQYGKIEGKNVFYWFQNHKARERQKKRFTLDMAAMQHRSCSTSTGLGNGGGGTTGVGINFGGRGGGNGGGWRQTDLHHPHDYYYAIENNHPSNIHNPVFSGIPPPSPTSPSSSHGVLTSVGPIGSSTSSGSVLMERRFRECSISAGGSSTIIGNSTSNNNIGGGWVSIPQNHNNIYHPEQPTTHHHLYPQYPYPTSSSTLKSSKILPIQLFKETDNNNNEEEVAPDEIETLPLFPMQPGEDVEITVENEIPNYFSASVTRDTSNGYNPLTGYYFRSSPVVVTLHDLHRQQDMMNGGILNGRTSLELSLNSYTPITADTVHGHHQR